MEAGLHVTISPAMLPYSKWMATLKSLQHRKFWLWFHWNHIKMTPWKVMVEFCRLFRYGFRPLVPVPELCSDTTPHRSDIAYAQARFCQSVMAPDVQCNTGYGVKVGLENMRLVALHHENLQVELVRLERGAEDSLIAYQETTTTITANMLRQALPHLITDDDEHGWDPVALKLIGQQLQVSGTLRFDWDFSTNKVVGGLTLT